MRALLSFLATALLILAWGCEKGQSGPNLPAPQGQSRGQAQPKLVTAKLWVGTNELTAELAATPEQVQKGMMFRTEMAENEGMLFIFAQPHRASFWMRNTLLPLSCAYLDSEGTVLEIHDMQPLDEKPIQASTDRVQYVLEMRQGWFQRHQVKPGMTLTSERGPLRQLWLNPVR